MENLLTQIEALQEDIKRLKEFNYNTELKHTSRTRIEYTEQLTKRINYRLSKIANFSKGPITRVKVLLASGQVHDLFYYGLTVSEVINLIEYVDKPKLKLQAYEVKEVIQARTLLG